METISDPENCLGVATEQNPRIVWEGEGGGYPTLIRIQH